MSKDFSNKSDNDLTNELSQIFVILMEISLWPCALITSIDLIIFDISSKLKSIECSLYCVRTCWLVGRTSSFLKGVHWSTKNFSNLHLYLLQIYHLKKELTQDIHESNFVPSVVLMSSDHHKEDLALKSSVNKVKHGFRWFISRSIFSKLSKNWLNLLLVWLDERYSKAPSSEIARYNCRSLTTCTRNKETV